MQFEINNRWTGDVLFTAEIDCEESAFHSVKVGLAVKWATEHGANLVGARLVSAYLVGVNLVDAALGKTNLMGADLVGATLARADLRDADFWGAHLRDANFKDADLARANFTGANIQDTSLVDGGQRSDGRRFVGWIKDGELRINAEGEDFNIAQAREFWEHILGGTPLGDETLAILDHIEAVNKIRGLARASAEKDALPIGAVH